MENINKHVCIRVGIILIRACEKFKAENFINDFSSRKSFLTFIISHPSIESDSVEEVRSARLKGN